MDPRKSFAKINFVGSFFQATCNHPRRFPRLKRPGAIFVLAALLTTVFFYSGSSASSKSVAGPKANGPAAELLLKTGLDLSFVLPATSLFPSFFGPMAPLPETVETFAADCTTAKSIFTYGDTVCVKVSGVETSFEGNSLNRRIGWVDPSGYIRENNDIYYTPLTTDPQTALFVLPPAETSQIDSFSVDNRGNWKANVVSSRGSVLLTIPFAVQGPTPTADLSISAGLAGVPGNEGDSVKYVIALSNQGPNDAASVELINASPINATFQSIDVTGAPGFSCTGTGPVTCTAASLPSGGSAIFEVTYIAGTAGSTLITAASATSATAELNPEDNATVAPSVRVSGGGTGATCSLGCPGNMTVSANTTQGEVRGAVVEFSVEPSGSCGAVTSTPASNTFFPVGTTTVSTTSAEGGGACSFTVTVVEAAAPTIECRANQTVAAAPGETSAEVAVGFPQATGNQISITGVRDDSLALDAPYPIGTTEITWTVTDADGRTAVCVQTIVVTAAGGGDGPALECGGDVAVTAADGACSATVVLVAPVADPSNVPVTGERSDGLPLTAPYPAGTTIVTWRAVDSFGRSASCLQTVTVTATDNTAPIVTAPSSRTFLTSSCSRVLDDELGVPNASDNCSGVSITTSGIPAGNVFPVGVTTLTYTATDAAGNTSAPVTQTITVKESPAIAPVITLSGSSSMTVECHTAFTDPGATATDNCDPSVTVNTAGSVDADVPGTYTLTYTATDASGNAAAPKTRTVTVVDTIAPVIAINGDSPMTVECHTSFTDPGATASDACDSTVPVAAAGSVNPDVVGTYTITYTASDDAGNAATPVVRTVNVVDTIAPTLTITGANPLIHECHTAFTDPGATASDSCAGDLTSAISAQSNVNPDAVGSYSITYTVSDGHNTTQVVRAVTVVDTTAPTMTMTGAVIALWPPNHQYRTVNLTQLVASASDSCDSGVDINDVVIWKVTSDETENGGGDGNTLNDIIIAADGKSVQLRGERNGSGNGRVYTLTFRVADPSGNVTTKTATVKVPKSQNGATAVDDGPQYCVGNCQ